MRRSLLAGIGVVAVLIIAACSPDQPATREPLAPTVPSLTHNQQCGGALASNISKQQKDLFTGAALTAIEAAFDAVYDGCPLSAGDPALQSYIATMISFSEAPTNENRAGGLVNLLGSITLYATGTSLVRPSSIFQTQGGAAVLSATGVRVMTTWDSRARLEIQTTTEPSGPHLWTFEPRPTSECDGTTSLRITGNCYQLHDYPDETVAYDDPFIVTLCLHTSLGALGIGHQTAPTSAFNGRAEVLEEFDLNFSCVHTTGAIDSWLGREAGPLGRALARAYDFLRPQPLFADDAGESGLGLFTSLFGGILNDIFSDNFDDPATFNVQSSTPGAEVYDAPDLGDGNWLFKSQSPGYIRIQDALGDMPTLDTDTGVVVLSQGQGACTSCPLFRLLGTRKNAGDNESVGSYAISWRSLQNKPSVKEAAFVILNAISDNGNTHDKSIEIARLSYVTVSSQNKLLFIVRFGTNDSTVYEVGNWVKDVSQTFSVTVNLTMLNSSLSQKISLSIDGDSIPLAPSATDPYRVDALRATFLKQIGYVLAGIDAGIIASDNWKITRLEDIPPP